MTVETLLQLAVVVPLLGAALTLVLHPRLALQRVVSLTTVAATLAVSVGALLKVEAEGAAAAHIGGWPPPFGIVLVGDLFSTLLLAVSMAVVLGVLVYALGQLSAPTEVRFFHPLYLVLATGVTLSFLTGDLFNLFVAFEVMLIASYALLTLGGQAQTVRPAMTYVVVSLLASTLFITGVALVYAATGTVNMADLAGRLDELPVALQSALSLLLLVVFGVKAAIFPLFFWLPDSYPAAPTSITAVFAGLLTKVGVYAIIRSQTVLFGGLNEGPDPVILVLAAATMIVGVIGAIAQDDIKRILSFHIISQIGYMIFGLGLFSAAGLAGATLYIVHHIPVKTALFLVGGMVETTTGTAALSHLSGLVRRIPAAGVLWMLPALSLGGLPPFSGFFAKLTLAQAGFADGRYVMVAVALAVSILTLFSMAKIWNGAFWGAPAATEGQAGDDPGSDTAVRGEGEPAGGGGRLRPPAAMTAATIGVVGLTLAIAVGMGPLWKLSERAGAELANADAYVETVLGAPDDAGVAGAGGQR